MTSPTQFTSMIPPGFTYPKFEISRPPAEYLDQLPDIKEENEEYSPIKKEEIGGALVRSPKFYFSPDKKA